MSSASKEYDRVSKALAMIATKEDMTMAVLHYHKPDKEGINAIVFSSLFSEPLTAIVAKGVDQAADEYGIDVICECGCELGDPVDRSVEEVLNEDEDDDQLGLAI